MTSAFTGGISVTCRRSIPVSAVPASPAPHAAHAGGSCRTTRSGWSSAPSSRPAAPSAGPVYAPSSSAATSAPACPARPTMAVRGVLRVLLHPRGKVSDLRLQIRYQHLHLADPRIRSASSSRSRAFAARSPAITSSAAASPGAGDVSGTTGTLSQPAFRNQSNTPSRLTKPHPGAAASQRRDGERDLTSYLNCNCPALLCSKLNRPPCMRFATFAQRKLKPPMLAQREVRRVPIGPGLWPGPCRQAARVGRGLRRCMPSRRRAALSTAAHDPPRTTARREHPPAAPAQTTGPRQHAQQPHAPNGT